MKKYLTQRRPSTIYRTYGVNKDAKIKNNLKKKIVTENEIAKITAKWYLKRGQRSGVRGQMSEGVRLRADDVGLKAIQ